MFLFAVYAGGLRFGDVIELQWKHFLAEDNRISKVIRKTGRQHSFKMGSVAIEILDKYKTKNSQPEDFIFPIMEYSDLYFKDNFFRSKETERHNALAIFTSIILARHSNFLFRYRSILAAILLPPEH
jgi:integrase/recombinase XerD